MKNLNPLDLADFESIFSEVKTLSRDNQLAFWTGFRTAAAALGSNTFYGHYSARLADWLYDEIPEEFMKKQENTNG